MGLSYASCAYAEPSSATSSVQLVSLGTRGRLFSVWFNLVSAAGTSEDPITFTLKDGSSSGVTIWESRVMRGSITTTGIGLYPYNLPEHGILFLNGLNAITDEGGMHSVTVTYSGPPEEI
jgi:hypothetical protein